MSCSRSASRSSPGSIVPDLSSSSMARTAITIGVSVVMPAKVDSDSSEPRVLAALKITAPASTGVVTGSESIDVVAVHKAGLPTVPCTSSKPSRTPEG
jgi:hypothetical protein